jgi:pilus assembly protein CpaB
MKGARLLVLAISLAAGGTAAWLVSHTSAPTAPPPPAVAMDTEEVLVATKDINIGQVLSAGDLTWDQWPRASAKSQIMRAQRPRAIEELKGRTALAPIASGEPVRENNLIEVQGSLLSAVLQPGMLAYSIEISPDIEAGGLIHPKDRVDVILSNRDRVAPGGEFILRDVRVLAIDQRVTPGTGGPAPVPSNTTSTNSPGTPGATSPNTNASSAGLIGKTATLEVTPKQAELLAMARREGTLSLALRSLAESRSATRATATPGVDPSVFTRITIVRFGQSTVTVCAGCTGNESAPSVAASDRVGMN